MKNIQKTIKSQDVGGLLNSAIRGNISDRINIILVNKLQSMEKKKISRKEYLQFSFVMIGILVFFITLMYLMSRIRGKEIQEINSDYSITKAVITKISLYKGHNVNVRFKVGDRIIEGSDGIQKPRNKNEGDSIWVKYSKKDPSKFITELNDSY